MTPYFLNEAFLEKITIIKVFPCRGEHVRTYISGSRCAWWQKTTNRHTYTHTHTHTRDNYSNPRCTHARRGLIKLLEAGITRLLMKFKVMMAFLCNSTAVKCS